MQNANTAALGALSSGLLAFQGHIRNMHQDAQQSGNPALSALPLHPAFPLQPSYPFYPGGLLAALRPHQMLQNRESGPEVKSPKSFTIDAILGDRDDKQENSSFEDSGDNPDGEAERGHSLSNRGASGRPAGRLEMAGPQFGGHPGHGLPHCPAALRYSQHFNTGNRHEKKPGHVSGSSWKGKSKRVRTIFTPEQLERLEAEFERQQYMVGTERYYLAASLNLTEAQVKVWFQNRRIKWRKQNLEQQHAKMAHFDLFTPDECSESDTECSDRKLMSSPEVREESMLHDDFSAQDATHKNTSFDSGISEDNAASKMAAAVVQRPEIAQYPMMYINPDTLHRATHDSEESGAALD